MHNCAWQIINLSADMAETFKYPAETSVDARWSGSNQHDPLLVGPIPAKPGT